MSLIDAYVHHAETYKGLTRGRIRDTRRSLLELEATLDGDLTSCDADSLTAFLTAKLEAGYHVNSVRQVRSHCFAFFRWLWHDQRAIDADAYMRIKAVPPPAGSSGATNPDPYSRTELAQFWTTLQHRFPLKTKRSLKLYYAGNSSWKRIWRHYFRLQVEAVIALALDLGLRRNEIWGLSLDDLHYDNEYVVVNGKGGKVREVPFTDNAREHLREWIETRERMGVDHDCPWVILWHWEGGSGGPMAARELGRLPERVMRLEKGRWTLHRFRHTCATERLRAGMDLEVVQRLLGHASPQQTLCYAQLVARDVARQMEKTQNVFDGSTRPPRTRVASRPS